MISSFQGFGEGVNVAEIIGGRFVSSIERVLLTHENLYHRLLALYRGLHR